MRYHLRTLLIVLAVGPMVLAFSYETVSEWRRRQAEAEEIAEAKAERERLNLTYMKAVYRRWRFDEAHPETASLVKRLTQLERQIANEGGNE